MNSMLFVPGDSARKMEKCVSTAADIVVLDLEDSVADAQKEAARMMVRDFQRGTLPDKRFYVRVNAFDTGLTLRDLAAAMPGRPSGIVLPKCQGIGDVERLGHILDGIEAVLGIAVGATAIVPIITETPKALLNISTYQVGHQRLWGMLWGAEDLAGAIGASSNRDGAGYRSPFVYARDACLMAAAAAGVVAIDTVCTDVKDMERVRLESEEARKLGFGAKAAIYPSHCEVINAAFAPSDEEVDWARTVVRALSENASTGVVVLNGKMIEKPHEVLARRILASPRVANAA